MLRPYTVPVTLDLLPLLLAALALGVEVDARQLAGVVVEDLEPSLAGGERTIIEFAGRELPVDPPHHPVGGDPVRFAWPGAVGEAVQYVQRGVVGGQLCRQSDGRTEGLTRQDQRGRKHPSSLARPVRPSDSPTVRLFHAVILTHSL